MTSLILWERVTECGRIGEFEKYGHPAPIRSTWHCWWAVMSDQNFGPLLLTVRSVWERPPFLLLHSLVTSNTINLRPSNESFVRDPRREHSLCLALHSNGDGFRHHAYNKDTQMDTRFWIKANDWRKGEIADVERKGMGDSGFAHSFKFPVLCWEPTQTQIYDEGLWMDEATFLAHSDFL